MAAIDYLLKDQNSAKRKVCVFSTTIEPANVTTDEGFDTAGTIAIGDVITLANIPKDSIVVSASVQVITGLTTGTQTVALAIGGTAVMAAVALGTADNATKGTTTVKQADGALTLTTGVAAMVDGKFTVLIEYIEPDLVTGDLTSVA